MSAIPDFLRDVGVRSVELDDLPADGMCDRAGNVSIHVGLDDLTRLVTLIHEYIHILYPDEPESYVREQERKLLNMLGIDPEKVGKAGIDEERLQKYRNATGIFRSNQTVIK